MIVPVNSFAAAIAVIEEMKRDGIVAEYAIGGAMALVFWTEPIPTFDLDVFVLLSSDSPLVSLGPIYDWARRKGFREEAEHIVIAGIPVQLIPAPGALAEEAIRGAAELEYEDRLVRVIRPEYLIALYLVTGARTQKRLQRVAALLEEGDVDRALLADLLQRYELRMPTYD
jgi:hypothetical protein